MANKTLKPLRIRKTFGKWSPGTIVHMIHAEKDSVTVEYIPTGEFFDVPPEYLENKRARNK